eukprot:TRINITY_DN23340_c0_g1_i1.p1 TRINITY_DN23340_c0_g1~~TRINITY_DN23340_c0_g1_i1.p1  ORF type:complete len:751 (+),score=140.64 TRINITY_DN23340_c0_g1_i1:282-2534(+)
MATDTAPSAVGGAAMLGLLNRHRQAREMLRAADPQRIIEAPSPHGGRSQSIGALLPPGSRPPRPQSAPGCSGKDGGGVYVVRDTNGGEGSSASASAEVSPVAGLRGMGRSSSASVFPPTKLAAAAALASSAVAPGERSAVLRNIAGTASTMKAHCPYSTAYSSTNSVRRPASAGASRTTAASAASRRQPSPVVSLDGCSANGAAAGAPRSLQARGLPRQGHSLLPTGRTGPAPPLPPLPNFEADERSVNRDFVGDGCGTTATRTTSSRLLGCASSVLSGSRPRSAGTSRHTRVTIVESDAGVGTGNASTIARGVSASAGSEDAARGTRACSERVSEHVDDGELDFTPEELQLEREVEQALSEMEVVDAAAQALRLQLSNAQDDVEQSSREITQLRGVVANWEHAAREGRRELAERQKRVDDLIAALPREVAAEIDAVHAGIGGGADAKVSEIDTASSAAASAAAAAAAAKREVDCRRQDLVAERAHVLEGQVARLQDQLVDQQVLMQRCIEERRHVEQQADTLLRERESLRIRVHDARAESRTVESQLREREEAMSACLKRRQTFERQIVQLRGEANGLRARIAQGASNSAASSVASGRGDSVGEVAPKHGSPPPSRHRSSAAVGALAAAAAAAAAVSTALGQAVAMPVEVREADQHETTLVASQIESYCVEPRLTGADSSGVTGEVGLAATRDRMEEAKAISLRLQREIVDMWTTLRCREEEAKQLREDEKLRDTPATSAAAVMPAAAG